MKRKIVGGCFFAVFLAFFPITGVFSISLEELTGPEQAKALLSGEKPVLAQFQDPKPQFVPANSVLQGIIDALRTELAPSVMVETLHIYKKPSEAENLAWSTGEQGGIFNEILALSTLAGLQYYSASRGKIWTFYQTS
ncbi:MAG: hypothetical protein FWF26_04380, partial [Treponema sp.]|nr:hypothetical protein [Treponema sp.]